MKRDSRYRQTKNESIMNNQRSWAETFGQSKPLCLSASDKVVLNAWKDRFEVRGARGLVIKDEQEKGGPGKALLQLFDKYGVQYESSPHLERSVRDGRASDGYYPSAGLRITDGASIDRMGELGFEFSVALPQGRLSASR